VLVLSAAVLVLVIETSLDNCANLFEHERLDRERLDRDRLNLDRRSIDDVARSFEASPSLEALRRQARDHWFRAAQATPQNIAEPSAEHDAVIDYDYDCEYEYESQTAGRPERWDATERRW
jgi:hypothetical protein